MWRNCTTTIGLGHDFMNSPKTSKGVPAPHSPLVMLDKVFAYVDELVAGGGSEHRSVEAPAFDMER